MRINLLPERYTPDGEISFETLMTTDCSDDQNENKDDGRIVGNMPFQETSKDFRKGMHESIKSFMEETGRHIKNNPPTDDNLWTLEILQDKFEFKIVYPSDKSYISIIFNYILEEEQRRDLAECLSKAGKILEFNHSLRSTITFLNLSYSFKKFRTPSGENLYVGFDVGARIFLPDNRLPEDYFENTIQNVINVGLLGISLFALNIGNNKMLIERLESPPDNLYM